MYSWEIQKFLAERNYLIGGNDLLFILDINQHPQIKHIQYDPYLNQYNIWDNEGNYFCFTPIFYWQTKEYQKVLKK